MEAGFLLWLPDRVPHRGGRTGGTVVPELLAEFIETESTVQLIRNVPSIGPAVNNGGLTTKLL